MLFFFELFLFVLVMLTLALGEFVSRWLALVLWLVVTVFTLVGYLFARQALGRLAAGDATTLSTQADARGFAEAAPSGHVEPGSAHDLSQPAPLDEKWARTLLYNWRRSNVLLVVGAVAVASWYWLTR